MNIAMYGKRQELDSLKTELSSLENEVQLHQEKVADKNLEAVMYTKSDGKQFCNKIREASYFLQSSGVAQRKVSDTLKNLTKTLSGESSGEFIIML